MSKKYIMDMNKGQYWQRGWEPYTERNIGSVKWYHLYSDANNYVEDDMIMLLDAAASLKELRDEQIAYATWRRELFHESFKRFPPQRRRIVR